MEVKILKKSINNQLIHTTLEVNYQSFAENKMGLSFKGDFPKYILVEINEDLLDKQSFRGSEWFRSKDKKYGIFKDDNMMFDNTKEKGWRLLFQGK